VVTMSAYLHVGDELAPKRQSVHISCKRPGGQVLALLRLALDQVSPQFRWDAKQAARTS
jgi:hypothetical protein